MSKILKAAERSNVLMAKFSATLPEASLEKAKTLPLMTATSLILSSADKTASGDLLPSGFTAIREALRRRFGVIDKLTKGG
jgi:hypothetical protein